MAVLTLGRVLAVLLLRRILSILLLRRRVLPVLLLLLRRFLSIRLLRVLTRVGGLSGVGRGRLLLIVLLLARVGRRGLSLGRRGREPSVHVVLVVLG